MKANPIVLHEQSNSFGHGNKGREGERLVKNHGPFHLLTPGELLGSGGIAAKKNTIAKAITSWRNLI